MPDVNPTHLNLDALSSSGITYSSNLIAAGLVAQEWGGGVFNAKSLMNPQGAAKLDGVTDDTASIQAALTAAGNVSATAAVRGSIALLTDGIGRITSPLNLTQNGIDFRGCGIYASAIMLPTSGWTGACAINITGSNCTVQLMNVQGQSATTASNPSADAILSNHGGDGTRLRDLAFFFINGWCVNVTPNGTNTTFGTFLTNLHMRLPKQGFHVQGASSTSYSVGVMGVNVLVDGATNGDGIFLDDATDCTFTSTQVQVTAGGNAVHVKGRSTANYFAGCDVGGTTTNTSPSLLVETNAGNNPKLLQFVGGTISLGTPGISVTAGTDLSFVGVDIQSNRGGGVIITGGDLLKFVGCTFDFNNTAALATTYEFQQTVVGPHTLLKNCTFNSTLTTAAINAPASSNVIDSDNIFGQGEATAGRNQLVLRGDNTGAAPAMVVQGIDTNTYAKIIPKGTGGLYVAPAGIGDYAEFTPKTGFLDIIPNGSSSNIDTRLFPKGTGNIVISGNMRRTRQTPSEAVLVSGVDASAGEYISVVLSAARLVGAPLNPATGQRLVFNLIQNGTGGFAVTWNAAFSGKTWADTGNTANKRSCVAWIYDGTVWNQDGAQAPYA